MTGPIFETVSVTKRYGGLTAVNGVSLAVNAGEVFGIAGPNGAGKTTFFDVVTGMTRATSGEVKFRGAPVTQASVTQICHRGIARTFQHPAVFDTQTVLANAVVGAQFGSGRHWWSALRQNPATLQRAWAELEFVGLADKADRLAGPLPVFDKKKLMIASALATEPEMLFLDEPFGGLSLAEIDELITLLTTIKDRAVTIVLIEHVMRALMTLSDRVLIMNQGQTLFEGTPAEVVAHEEVVRVYLGEAMAPSAEEGTADV
ncbi:MULTISPECIES: ABC transporter ATP-binding protein [unclassified Mycolicibacterium]|uniref:ABC transporter ATP-binding protein n=1 Tax=unclassified Mycolicibacterium TaxID=2636767 RepID=UPI0012DBDDF5|nr:MULTISPECIES: ABC transporter ATP-binding protein [unclassified Mycolicibacterium]MUL81031.1 ABC transporter ATP-binding protein [Mycolicibacterium sp. CBMA 329]MUL86797.1 ABC transporter ATP-binding protein [Mycolicibacterium sp. CBMA 331]MUL98918.1 ABC transporter ATP-binding protein [Mycolicibacterium sp. CBMA 334]MUM28793.1 ABC transporter ATP-binding protein [Mycolicibacterium sp. CBMA 295]MUM37094.1 ABC transporter ATP-binding protein [Mycolicibacterium sp. CBMA 247]